MKLDVASASVAGGARRGRAQIVREAFCCCVVDDAAIALAFHSDVELIVDTRFAEVFGSNSKVDVAELVRSRVTADEPSAGRLVRFWIDACALVYELVGCNCGPMSIQPCAVVVILKMAPGRRTVLASPADGEVCFRAIVHNPAAPRQKVARRRGPGLDGAWRDKPYGRCQEKPRC